MRKVFTTGILFLLVSCLSEKGVKPGTTSTFVRYFNGGNNDTAVALEETPDKGFIIMANTKIQKAEADVPNYKIKLIRTDQNGVLIWTKLFPDITDKVKNYSGSSLQLLPSGGYVITGDDIQTQSDGSTKIEVLVITVDDNGNQLKNGSLTSPISSGNAVAVNATGNFLILSTSGTDNMYLAEINNNFTAPLNSIWTIPYSAGQTTLADKLFIDETGKILWAGVVTKNGLTGIRMIKTAPNSLNADFDLLISRPGFSEIATDFCRFGYNYAITGSTNEKTGSATPGGDTDILFKRLGPDGTVLSSQSFPFGDGTTPDNQNDVGNSISSTQDGGLILLSSVSSAALNGGKTDTDYYLIKINAFGDKVWTSTFGSRFKDEGVSVRESSDGGYVVLGTTTQGSLKLVTLTKTDKLGQIQ